MIIIWFFLLNFVDTLTTIYAFSLWGFWEANLIYNLFFNWNIMYFLIYYKLIWIPLIISIFYVFYSESKTFNNLLYGANVWLLFIVIFNLIQIYV
jgi:hypothetical protein